MVLIKIYMTVDDSLKATKLLMCSTLLYSVSRILITISDMVEYNY